jgi:hypothetical protein
MPMQKVQTDTPANVNAKMFLAGYLWAKKPKIIAPSGLVIMLTDLIP